MNKINEFEKLVAPIQEWLKRNYNPHTTAVISDIYAKLVVDELGCPSNNETLEVTDITGRTITIELDGKAIAEAVVPLQNTKWISDLAEKISEKMMLNANT